MSVMPCQANVETYFAPAFRAAMPALQHERMAFFANQAASLLLESMSSIALVLNKERQVLVVNSKVLQLLGLTDDAVLVGVRPGEMMGCIHAPAGPAGCGTARACATCGSVLGVLECLETHRQVTRDTRLRTHGLLGESVMDLRVQASFITLDESSFVVVAIEDISAEKRRRVLERVFFHDILNTAGGIQGLAEMLLEETDDPVFEQECKQDIAQLSAQIVEEITAQRQLMAAENGDLQLNLTEIAVTAVVNEIAVRFRNQRMAERGNLQLGKLTTATLTTDVIILRRVLGNIVKNALEAICAGEMVTLSTTAQEATVTFTIHNPGVMSQDIQLQIFQRSFSTKPGDGHGIGTYSIKLFTEKYLGGTVAFISDAEHGTIFSITLPKKLEA